ncbi:MAG: (2Fe-2S)-binding protein [Immundisolibacteraceae bacterium]|nr:(2Fe-2S)-binding protein [Immundisolibacteraceae bacterium]
MGNFNMYVCLCRDVTEKQIRKKISCGVNTVSALREQLGAGGQCGRCKDFMQGMINERPAAVLVKGEPLI